MTVVAFIPARAGSKRIPRKNIARVGDRPLLHRAMRTATDAGCEVVVSSDSSEVFDCANGAPLSGPVRFRPHHRPAEHATDTAQIEPAIAHWLASAGLAPTDTIVMLQCTAPFLKPATIRRVIEAARAAECGCALTVTRFPKAYFAGYVDTFSGHTSVIWNDERGDLSERPRTQDLEKYVYENGCAYAFSVAHFLKTQSRMHEDAAPVVIDWLEGLDIDDQQDLDVARLLAPMMDGQR